MNRHVFSGLYLIVFMVILSALAPVANAQSWTVIYAGRACSFGTSPQFSGGYGCGVGFECSDGTNQNYHNNMGEAWAGWACTYNEAQGSVSAGVSVGDSGASSYSSVTPWIGGYPGFPYQGFGYEACDNSYYSQAYVYTNGC